MSLATRITSLLTSLTPGQVGAMAPADRQLLTDQCRRVLQLADAGHAPKTTPKEGILADLRDGRGRHE
jgi:hypothetical protein